MFERPSYENAEPAILNEDQSAVARREIRDMLSALNMLGQMLAPGAPVERNLIYNILYVSEARLAQLGTLTGVETDSAEARDNRSASLRIANTRIRELEHQLGGVVTPEHTKQAVAHQCKKLDAWWRNAGLGLVSEAALDSWGSLKVTLSCTLFGNTALLHSETPVADKAKRTAWLESLVEKGFILLPGAGNAGHIAACDASRDAVLSMIRAGLPSAELLNIKTQHTRTGMSLRDVTITVTDLNDIADLPDLDKSCF